MSRVKGRGNVTTELRLASLLRRAGLKGWRRHQPLPGCPDFVWRKEKLAVFVDGCFWHGHDCGKNVSPKTNADAWREKLERNRKRDRRADRTLRSEGWSVVRVWECELRSSSDKVVRKIRCALLRGAQQRH
jgi:DNA mismatch endonuclease (patch repair protein)